MLQKDKHAANRIAWNAATDAHNSHKRDQAAFFRGGGSTLFPEEIDLLEQRGSIAGKRLLHLQCNSGQDTLSLALRGAAVTGVDISDTAIAFARQLSADAGIPAAFERADVYDWLPAAALEGRSYDLVFSSYGATAWLSDLATWARGIAAVLAPGGRFVLVEFHPYAMVFDKDWAPSYSYFGGGELVSCESGVGDYVALSGPALAPSGYLEGIQGFKNPHPGHEFIWTIADTLSAVLEAGLALSAFCEYPYSNAARLWSGMRETPGWRMVPPEGVGPLPLMFGLAADKV